MVIWRGIKKQKTKKQKGEVEKFKILDPLPKKKKNWRGLSNGENNFLAKSIFIIFITVIIIIIFFCWRMWFVLSCRTSLGRKKNVKNKSKNTTLVGISFSLKFGSTHNSSIIILKSCWSSSHLIAKCGANPNFPHCMVGIVWSWISLARREKKKRRVEAVQRRQWAPQRRTRVS